MQEELSKEEARALLGSILIRAIESAVIADKDLLSKARIYREGYVDAIGLVMNVIDELCGDMQSGIVH